MDINLKEIVKTTYLQIIRGALNKILVFDIDSLMNDLIRMHIINPPQADEVLVITDKFFLYKKLWQGILETLYEIYLPNTKYVFDWEIEITPYTLMLCDFTKEYFESKEVELQKKILNVSNEQIELDFDSLLVRIKADTIGLKYGLKDKIPNNLIPKTKKEELVLLFRLMNFPPLGELSVFIELYNQNLKQQINDLSVAFSRINTIKVPSLGREESLHYSYCHIDHLTFKKYGFDIFENHPYLSLNKADFTKIKEKVLATKDLFKDNVICPCCGNKQEIKLPEEVLQYKFLLENQSLCKKIGLLYFDDFIENYNNNLSEKFNSFFPNINNVDNPQCLILVEGDSEETAIPILAFRKKYVLSMHGVQVYNSQSKGKLANDFLNFKHKYPNRKMICLLDSDAIKERNDIQRIVKNHQDKYKLIFINKGTFEDIFDLNISIKILNEIYTEGLPIEKTDFDSAKDFLTNIKKILFEKKQTQFDKVSFARKISFKIDVDRFPNEVNEIIDTAKLFVEQSKYLVNN
ncbi:hypothetical protein EZS27_021133 [termite gut metagenome]|uniref:Uncharacterized protein n=1 Tax=termite gut metagenome TaxID=433724 RepID=A0A5J4RAX8_9ZZZZ